MTTTDRATASELSFNRRNPPLYSARLRYPRVVAYIILHPMFANRPVGWPFETPINLVWTAVPVPISRSRQFADRTRETQPTEFSRRRSSGSRGNQGFSDGSLAAVGQSTRARPDGKLLPIDMRKSRRSSPSNRSQQSAHNSDSSGRGCANNRLGNESRLTRKRASKPKVRTGCISCKRRHVKCDEGKPSCAECERLGLMCEGYAPPKTKAPAPRPERLLLPKPSLTVRSDAASTTPPRLEDYRPPISPTPGFGFELGQEDKWYFTLFRDQICHELSPHYRSNFWTRTSLRDCMVNRCIHHSILSIGAYARALIDLREGSPTRDRMPRTWWPPWVLNKHHQAALTHHAKALSHLRSNIRLYGIDGRLTMAATLLFIVFENMQGNYHSSGNLIRSGIKVLRDIRNRGNDSRSILRHQWHRYLTTPQDEVDEIANIFARYSVTFAHVPFAHGKFAYHMLLTEDDDDSDDDDDLEYTNPFTLAVPPNLEHAKQTWDYLSVQLANFQNKAAWHILNPDYDFDEAAAVRKQERYLTVLHDLGLGLNALFFSSVDGRESRGIELLRLQHALAVIAVSCCLDPTETMYDGFLPQFEDVIQRCRLFMNYDTDVPAKIGFASEIGLLPLLAFVGARCRTARIRLEAVELMRSYQWREGSWDNSSLARVITGLMKLEGQLELRDSGDADRPKVRYTWSNMFWDFERQRMHVEYTKMVPDYQGEFEKVRCTIGGV
ncbi:hypothetical protein GGS23DRAFT_559146 [Durotheca rogersii]|uniref:uncharacterized protein n=1 Tax=Durotheca rogersii TaxID=419775 RepID=UPI0022206A28|nr:uncharacterized protein GGS23DRAFT_559146 [Durotheca rogersii]KAI5865412.1 hypothetical protein GGS23DRAFT_559146 [Durotheca rogersii]